MAGDSTFDVVSEFDQQELVNALDQVRREVDLALRPEEREGRPRAGQGGDHAARGQRDARGGGQGPDRIEAVRRGLSLKIFDWGTVRARRRQHRAAEDRAAERAAR